MRIKNILFFDKVESTQLLAKEFIFCKKDLLIVANEQEKGYGRYQRFWYSPIGGLYFSFLLNLEKEEIISPFDIIFHIVKSVTISCEEVFILKEKLQIKWPNDIYYQDRKLCGILAEKFNSSLICGCGINLNNNEFPQEINNAISLKEILKREINSYEKFLLLENILQKINYQEIRKEDLLIFLKERNYLKNKKVKILLSYKKEITGICVDIDEDYSLLLEKGIKIFSGEVEKVYL
ncbi:MAG: biotin--[acetyl-CoA-carboxylase] ligase [candidate division WOR-3 bacterium]|nr:biotin--[acetyl-CoA-carboxylase] ligase [candidate division WOR-3 bacterium]MCX7836668.1 biotin--[acetyl-CoA-carboxylase] ligase [candidate division WOR-3 bacterium]MDW8113691.1 biotin--[acetyl-CoA-carboxylase] ligase [candidate division WOR-3 bacterium]